MKLIEMFEPVLLMEANVLNPDVIDGLCRRFSMRVEDPRGRQWFEKKLRAFILNTPSLLEPLAYPPGEAPDDLPSWAAQAAARGDLYYFRIDGPTTAGLTAKLDHIVDWFNALTEIAHRQPGNDVEMDDKRLAEKHLAKLMRYEPDQIEAVANDWYHHMGSRAKLTKQGVDVVHRWPDGHYLVTYSDFDTYSSDGNDLQNCMRGGNYWRQVETGEMQVYALRKPNDEAVVAFRVDNEKIVEAKGKQNQPPVAAYAPYVIDALNLIGLPPSPSGLTDIRPLDIVVTAETRYGTMRAVSSPGLTFEDQSEFRLLTTHDNERLVLFFATPNEAVSTFSFKETGKALTLDQGIDLGPYLPKIRVLLKKMGRTLAAESLAKGNVYINRGEMGMPGEVGDLVMDFPNGDRVVSLDGDHKIPHDAMKDEGAERFLWPGHRRETRSTATLFLIDHRSDQGTPYLRMTLEGTRLTEIRSVYQKESFPRDTLAALIETQGYELASTAFWGQDLATLDGHVVGQDGGEVLTTNALGTMMRYDGLLAVKSADGTNLLFSLKGDRVTDMSGYTMGGKAYDFMKSAGLEVFRERRLKLAPSVAKWLVERFNTYAYDGQYGDSPSVGERVLATPGGDWYRCEDRSYYLVRQGKILMSADVHLPKPEDEDYYPHDVFKGTWMGGRVDGAVSVAVRDLFNHLRVPQLPPSHTESLGVYWLGGGQWGIARQTGQTVETRSGLTASIITKSREITLYDGDHELISLRWEENRETVGNDAVAGLHGRTISNDVTPEHVRQIGMALQELCHAVSGYVLMPRGDILLNLGIHGNQTGAVTFLDMLGKQADRYSSDPDKLRRLLNIWQPSADQMIAQARLEKLVAVGYGGSEKSRPLAVTLDWGVMLREGRLGEAQDAIADIFRERLRAVGRELGELARHGIKTFKIESYGDAAEQFRDLLKYLGMTKEFKALLGDGKIRKA